MQQVMFEDTGIYAQGAVEMPLLPMYRCGPR